MSLRDLGEASADLFHAADVARTIVKLRADRASVIAEAKRVVETSVNLCAQPAVLRELKDHILAALDAILKETAP